MEKNYNRIRLEYNEGKIRGEHETKTRHEWKDSVHCLPTQERPDAGQLGYNKHFYEVELIDGRTMKFRMDVYDKEDTRFTETDVRNFVALKLTQEETANLIKTI